VIDESFHLTPLDVRRTEFPGALRGYEKARVDEFRDRVANELERLTRVNQELDAKAKGFHEQLRAFRDRDKALNEALVSAQQLRADTRTQAEREAQLLLREAQADGEQLIERARAEVRRLAAEIEGLERARRAYLAQFRQLVGRQLAELDAIPDAPTTAIVDAVAPDARRRHDGGAAAGVEPAPAPATVAAASPPPAHQPPPPPLPVAGAANGSPAPASPPSASPPASSPPERIAPPGEPTTGGARGAVQTPAWLNAVPRE